MSPNKYAVMGNPISHSLSPTIHQRFAKQTGITLTYEKIQSDLAHFEHQVTEFFTQGGKGLNITLPFKPRAFAMAQERTARCTEARAANTLWMQAGKLYADNTDGVGLLRDLRHYVDLEGKRVLLLGAGGAACGVIGPLLAAKPEQVTVANRTLKNAQILQQDFPKVHPCAFTDLSNTSHDVVINATSASLASQNIALPASLMAAKPFCYDLAYSKNEPTAFVMWCRAHDCKAVDGLGMLVEQAAEAFFIWHNIMPDTTSVLNALRRE